MSLWVSCASANEARALGGEELSDRVFEQMAIGIDTPILRIERLNAAGQTREATPLLDAAKMSMRLLAAVAGFFMLTGLIIPQRENDFVARLKTRNLSIECFRLFSAAADVLYMLPCAAVPLIAFALSGQALMIVPMFMLFALYLVSLGGIAAMTAKLKEQTSQLLMISLLTIANVMLGGLLMPLPSSGFFGLAAHLLPARWLSSVEIHGIWLCIAGLLVSALFYNALPFIFRKQMKL